MNLNSRFLVTYVALLCLLVSALFIHDIDAKHHKKKTSKAPKPSPSSNGNDASPSPSSDDPTPSGDSKTLFNVNSYDNDFQRTWEAACGVAKSVVLVPTGNFLVGPMTFNGEDCKPGMTFQVDGIIQAPKAVDAWGDVKNWINFNKVTQFTLTGNGTFDGQAGYWWKIKSTNKPTLVRIGSGKDVTVSDLNFVSSPQAHLKFNNCTGAVAYGITITSPEDSPNTDGIHISNSQQITIRDSIIGCGDDCVSMAEGCSGIVLERLTCGPSHGISIGSLGDGGTTAYVSDITVSNSKVSDSDNCVRIKSYKGGDGAVSNVNFEDIECTNVTTGICIDQYYTDENDITGDGSSIDVNNIVFENIRGTYTKFPLQIYCGPKTPCNKIKFINIDLRPLDSGKDKGSKCQNVYGEVTGNITSQAVQNCLNNKTSS